MLSTLVTRFIMIRMRNGDVWLELFMCVLKIDIPVLVGNANMARKNNFVIYEEVYMFMITFFIYKDNVFQIS